MIAALLLVVAGSPCAQEASARDDGATGRIPVLLISGANNHDWEWTSPSLQKILEESGRFSVTLTREPAKALADADAIAKYRAFVLDYNGPSWGEVAKANFVEAVEGGAGVSVIHAANNAFRGWVEYEKMVALMWRDGTGHGPFHPFDVKITDRDHPVTHGMADMRMHPDELYHRMVHMHDTDYRLLGTAHSAKKFRGTGKDEPMILVKNYGKGRIFHTALGHVWKNVPASRASHADPQFRQLVARGTEWAATGKVTLSPTPPNFLTAEEKKAGFQLLFNGRDASGWRGYKKKGPLEGWVVKQGALVLPAGVRGGDVITEAQFGDFDLRFEFKIAKGSNSGVIYRVRETQGATYMTGPEYQVIDDLTGRHREVHKTASLYDMVAPAGARPRPVGQFNTGRIVIQKGRLQHWLNGVKVLESPIAGDEWKAMIQKSKFRNWSEFGTHAKGHIAFQDHGNEVWYRSVRIRKLDE